MFKKLKSIFKKDEPQPKETSVAGTISKEPSKYLVKKIVFEEFVTKDELEEIMKQYKEDHKPIEAKRNGMTMISFPAPRKYKLEVEEYYENKKENDDDDYYDDEEENYGECDGRRINLKDNFVLKLIISMFLSFCCYGLFKVFNDNFLIAYAGGGIVLTILNFIDDNNK